MSYQDLVVTDDVPPFDYIDPPIKKNAEGVRQYPLEVTGYHLLDCMRQRLGWKSFEGKRLLDFGCGVRFARTIYNLNLPFSHYAGVDVHAKAISWLQEHLPEPRFRFAHINAKNAMYNKSGDIKLGSDALEKLGLTGCDDACMFSVVTHQSPDEARLTFAQIRHVIPEGGSLYFTALTRDSADSYYEATSEKPGLHSTYNTGFMLELVESQGWRVLAIYLKGNLQQTVYVCRAVGIPRGVHT